MIFKNHVDLQKVIFLNSLGLISVWHVLTCAEMVKLQMCFLSWLILESFRWCISDKEQYEAK